jgi:8-hydroxy-5-deazaflavin:NADPH oxidoreductase
VVKIAIVGAGAVGKTLGAAFGAKGHDIVYGVRDEKASAQGNTRTVGAAIASAEIVVLCTPWAASESVVCEHAAALAGKLVIDATNPLTPNLTGLALGFDTSGAELLQSQARAARFYKAFNSTGVAVMARPQFAEGKAAMFVAGPDGPDKKKVLGLVAEIGFEAIDAGELKAARLLEPLAMLWVELALKKGEGLDFAFVIGRRQGGKPKREGAR